MYHYKNKIKQDKTQPYYNENIPYLDCSGGYVTVKIHTAVHLKKIHFSLGKLYFSKLTLYPSSSCSIWCLIKVDLEVHLSTMLVEYEKMKKEIRELFLLLSPSLTLL